MKSIAIVRGFGGLRSFDINFYKACNKFKVSFIHPLHDGINLDRGEEIKLQLEPKFLIDPVSSILGKKHLLSWSFLKNLEKQIELVDIVNTVETHFFISRQCAEICQNIKKPLAVYVSQNIINHFSTFTPPYSLNTKIVCNTASIFIAISKKAKSYLLSLGIEDKKIKIINPGINIEQFVPREDFCTAAPIVLFVGVLSASKGIPELLNACRLLWDKSIDFNLWVCGSGPLEDLVKDYSRKYPIKYFGSVAHERIHNIYRQCDIFCLPSKDTKIFGITQIAEQFGYVLAEAMSSGLPIITTNCGSIPEVVGNSNIVVNQGSVKALSEGLFFLITDYDKRKKIGKNNRTIAVNNFNLKLQANKLQNELLKILT